MFYTQIDQVAVRDSETGKQYCVFFAEDYIDSSLLGSDAFAQVFEVKPDGRHILIAEYAKHSLGKTKEAATDMVEARLSAPVPEEVEYRGFVYKRIEKSYEYVYKHPTTGDDIYTLFLVFVDGQWNISVPALTLIE